MRNLFALPIYKRYFCAGIQFSSSVKQVAYFLAMRRIFVKKVYLVGKIRGHWGSFVRLYAFRITCNVVVATKVNF
jgi:hypothetical protein